MSARRARTSALVTAAAAIALVAAGCDGGGTGTTGGDAFQAGEDDGVITIFAQQDTETDLNTNSLTLMIEEEFDVDLQFETTTMDAGAAGEARQIALASGDYPDAFLLVPWVDQFSSAELLKLGGQGVLRPLNDLLEEDAPNIEAAWEQTPEWEQMATAPDGTVWGLPQWNDCFHCSYGAKLWMNSAWLDAVGMEQPTTPEELREVLTAFKNDDPNGNGQADEIPLSGAVGFSPLPYLMNPFVYVSAFDATGATPASLALDGDTVQLQPTQDGWRQGLSYIHGLYEDGLIDEAAFSQNADALKAKGDNADAALLGAAGVLHPYIFVTAGQEDGRDADYDAVAPLTGPAGNGTPHLTGSMPGATFAITNNASDAEAAKLVEIIDWMVDYQNHLRAEFGVPDVQWRGPQDGDVALDPDLDPLFATLSVEEGTPEWDEAQNSNWAARAQYYSSSEFRNSQIVPEDIYDPAGYERRLFQATELYEPHASDATFPYWTIWVDSDTSTELAPIQTNIESLVNTAAAEFITGVRDIDSDDDWQAFQDELTGYGADRYVEIYQDAYNATS